MRRELERERAEELRPRCSAELSGVAAGANEATDERHPETLTDRLARAGEHGFHRVSLSVNFDNPSARVHRRLGFHEIGSDEDS